MFRNCKSFTFTLFTLAICMLVITMSAIAMVFGEESGRLKFVSPSIRVQVDGKIYEVGYIQVGAEKYLIALDSKRKVVEDRKVLDKIFFVEYVYRPFFDKPGNFIGPTDIGGYTKLDEFRFMLQLGDVTLFIREAGVRALVQAGKIYITGGSSAGTAVAEKIAEKTTEHLIKSILKNPATYLKARESLVFEDAAARWKRAETLFLRTKGNNILKYEDAKKIQDDLSYARAYGTGSMMFLGRLQLKEGGGGDLLSQLGKIGEYAFDEFVTEVKGLYKEKDLVTATMLGYKLEKFLLDKVPIYKDYVENTKSFYKELNEFYEKYYLPERIKRNLVITKSKSKDHLQGTVSAQIPSVATTNFYPAKHGFRFDNNWKGYGPLEELGLCAGMVLTALDLFHAGCNASYFDRPEPTSALYRHILLRQLPISVTSVPQDLTREHLLQAMGILLGPGDRAQNNSIYSKIKERLVSGVPVPIGLIGETGQLVNSHVVLGYQLSEFSGSLQRKAMISVYDPNRGIASGSTLDILWDSETDRMKRISLTDSNARWAELRFIGYQPWGLENSCAMLELQDTMSRYWTSLREKNWQNMLRIVGTAENASPASPQRRMEVENAMIEMLKRQWSQTNLKGWQVLDTKSIGDGRYKIECLMHIGVMGKDGSFPFRMDLYFHREGDSWKIYKAVTPVER